MIEGILGFILIVVIIFSIRIFYFYESKIKQLQKIYVINTINANLNLSKYLDHNAYTLMYNFFATNASYFYSIFMLKIMPKKEKNFSQIWLYQTIVILCDYRISLFSKICKYSINKKKISRDFHLALNILAFPDPKLQKILFERVLFKNYNKDIESYQHYFLENIKSILPNLSKEIMDIVGFIVLDMTSLHKYVNINIINAKIDSGYKVLFSVTIGESIYNDWQQKQILSDCGITTALNKYYDQYYIDTVFDYIIRFFEKASKENLLNLINSKNHSTKTLKFLNTDRLMNLLN